MTADKHASDKATLERQVTRLAADRTALFGRAAGTHGLNAEDQRRLATIERELDECFLALRQRRAENDSRRFERDQPFFRRPVNRVPGAAPRAT